MRMPDINHKTTLFIAVVSFLTAVSSCSNIEPDERYTYVEPAAASRCIVVEDFTGQNCKNCPNATDGIAQLQQTYGADTIIAIAIHSGPFGHESTLSSPRLPLCTALGDDYFKHWGITGQPSVMFNRQKTYITPYVEYFGVIVQQIMATSTPVTLSVDTAYCDADDPDKLTVTVSGYSVESVQGKLQVYVLEDNIVNFQIMPDGSVNNNYVHNHVLRASITDDDYGDPFNIDVQKVQHATYTTKLDPSWNKENIHVVAFVYNDKDGVLQATKKHITLNTNKQ